MTEGVAIIDVWYVETFDSDLRGDLDIHTDVIRDYMLTSRHQWLKREASNRTVPYHGNPYAGEFMWVKEHIMRLMEARTIRAWPYPVSRRRRSDQSRADMMAAFAAYH